MMRTGMRVLGLVWLVFFVSALLVGAEESTAVNEQGVEQSFSARVKDFWTWWEKHSDRIQASADVDGGQVLQSEMTDQVEKLGPDFGWSLGLPPEGKQGHSFTLSPSGERGLFFLTAFWAEQAPEIENWHFYSSQQPNPKLSEIEVVIDENTLLKAKNIWISLVPAPSGQVFDVVAWSPAFEGLSPQDSRYLGFLFLGEALGENDLARWISNIRFAEKKPAEAFLLTQLVQEISTNMQAQGWIDSPYESTQFYFTIKEPGNDFLRHDIEQLSTLYSELSIDYLEARGEVANPIAGTGASLRFFRIPKDQLPAQGDVMESFRYVQGVLDLHLRDALAGKAIGGGIGAKWAYFDLIFFDEAAGLGAVQEVIKRFEGEAPVVHSFTEKPSVVSDLE